MPPLVVPRVRLLRSRLMVLPVVELESECRWAAWQARRQAALQPVLEPAALAWGQLPMPRVADLQQPQLEALEQSAPHQSQVPPAPN